MLQAALCVAIQLYLLVILVRILMSWFPPTPGTTYATIYDAFVSMTEPVLGPVRQMLPPLRMGGMGLDLSPIVVFVGGQILARIVC
jgi:YggT family protein